MKLGDKVKFPDPLAPVFVVVKLASGDDNSITVMFWSTHSNEFKYAYIPEAALEVISNGP